MKNPYEIVMTKLELFNQWEKSYNRSLSIERRLAQFTELFDLGLTYQKENIEKMHNEHLAALCSWRGDVPMKSFRFGQPEH